MRQVFTDKMQVLVLLAPELNIVPLRVVQRMLQTVQIVQKDITEKMQVLVHHAAIGQHAAEPVLQVQLTVRVVLQAIK